MNEFKIESGIAIPEPEPEEAEQEERDEGDGEEEIGKPSASEPPLSLTEKLLNQAHYGTRSAWQWVRSIKERVDLPELDEAMRLIVIARGKIEEKQRYLASHQEPENVIGSESSLATVEQIPTTLQEEGPGEAESLPARVVDQGPEEGEASGLVCDPQSADARLLDPGEHS
jgi:hypothetical protein